MYQRFVILSFLICLFITKNTFSIDSNQKETTSQQISSVDSDCGSYYFDGNNQGLYTNNLTPNYGTEGTIEAWINLASISDTTSMIYGDWDVNPHKLMSLGVTSEGRVRFLRAATVGLPSIYFFSNTILNTNNWYHIAVTWKVGEKIKMYLNGTLDAISDDVIENVNNNTSYGIQVGYQNYNSIDQLFFNGRIDEIHVSDIVLTASEIYYHYYLRSEVIPDENTKILWHFNGEVGTSSKLLNSQGNQEYDLTEYNNPICNSGFNESYICIPEQVNLLTPVNNSLQTYPIVNFSWSSAPCGDRYRIQYSSDPNFPDNSSQTVTFDLPFTNSTDILFPDIATSIYWRIYTLYGDELSPPSETWMIDYQPAFSNEITSLTITTPQTGWRFAYNTEFHANLKVTSTYTGNIEGNWLIDGEIFSPISQYIIAGESNSIQSPSLPSDVPGSFTLTAQITNPNQISSSGVTYEIIAPEYGPADHLQIYSSPNTLKPDGISTSEITVTLVDAEDRRVWDDGGATTYVGFELIGSGYIPETSPLINGMAQATYISGTTEETVTLATYCWLPVSQLISTSTFISLSDPSEELLSKHDFASNYLSYLTTDMFALYPYPIDPSFEFDQANTYVNNTIRDQNPTEIELESFERLTLAEELIYKSYRFNPDNSNPYGGSEEIGGAQELLHAGIKNTITSVEGAVTVFSIVSSAITFNPSNSLVKNIMNFLKSLIDEMIDQVLLQVDNLIKEIPDEELRNSLVGLPKNIKSFIEFYVTGSLGPLLGAAQSPFITSQITSLYLNSYPEDLQDNLNISITNSESNNTSNSIQEAKVNAKENLNLIKNKSSNAINTINSNETSFTLDLKADIDAINEAGEIYKQDKTNWWKLSDLFDKCLNFSGNIAGTNKLVGGGVNAKLGFTTYGEIKKLVAQGITSIYENNTSNLQFESYTDQLYRDTASTSSILSISENQLSDNLNVYANLLNKVKNLMLFNDTEYIILLLDSIDYAVETDLKYQNNIKTIVMSTYQGANSSVPYFDSLVEIYNKSLDESLWRHFQSVLAISNYLLTPSDSSLISEAFEIFDSTLFSIENTIENAHSVRESIFLIQSEAAITVELSNKDNQPHIGDTITSDIIIKNIGGTEAINNLVKISTADDIVLLSNDSISIPNLMPGDSVIVPFEITFEENLHPAQTQFMETVFITPSSLTGISRIKAVTYFVTTDYCCTSPTGDINYDGGTVADISDLLYLVDYMFTPGSPAPECSKEADINGDGGLQPDISDLLYLVDYMFIPGASAPADCQ